MFSTRNNRRSHAHGRGALLCVASVLCGQAFADSGLRQWVAEEYRGRSYMLVERPGETPTLYLFDARDGESAELTLEQLARMRRIDLAMQQLASADPSVREDAVLALADEDDASLAHLIVTALNDESADVRDAAEAALEDLTDR